MVPGTRDRPISVYEVCQSVIVFFGRGFGIFSVFGFRRGYGALIACFHAVNLYFLTCVWSCYKYQ